MKTRHQALTGRSNGLAVAGFAWPVLGFGVHVCVRSGQALERWTVTTGMARSGHDETETLQVLALVAIGHTFHQGPSIDLCGIYFG